MTDQGKYYVVKFRAFAFDTKEQGDTFAEKLMDAFCAMPEANGYGASSEVVEVLSDE